MVDQINGRIETEHTEVNANFRDVQENFNSEIGFVSRRDIRRGELEGRRERCSPLDEVKLWKELLPSLAFL